MPERLRYRIDLTGRSWSSPVTAEGVRAPTRSDREALSTLMLDAYVGTIDYDDEDIDDARSEVDSYLANEPLLSHSRLVVIDGQVVSAVLLCTVDGSPFIAYVMTHPDHKRSGIARLAVTASLGSLVEAGEEDVTFYITDGNRPSEGLFTSLGAVRVDDGA